ncbi:BspA family leucine-rich repeat surface protein, partial [Adlercreutzia sp. R25]|uniref:BspA family leucine-rich repeat surface protein n=1 Tax=Adlercreutzia shanghongiae TaxID=3111773 RepID=UPI002DB90D70
RARALKIVGATAMATAVTLAVSMALVPAALAVDDEGVAAQGIYAIFYDNPHEKSYTLVIQNGDALDPSYPEPSKDQVVAICTNGGSGCRCGDSVAVERAAYVTEVVIEPGVAPHSLGSWFFGMSKVKSIDLSGLDVSQVADASYMFSGCVSLTNVSLPRFESSKLTNMEKMFRDCSSLSSVVFPGSFKTDAVTNMNGLFLNCASLKSVDGSVFNTANVTDMGSLFSGCSSLRSVDLSRFNTAQVRSMSSMFSGCRSLQAIDVSKFDTSKVTNMGGMFFACSSLASLDVSKFDMTNVKNSNNMLKACYSLKTVKVGEKGDWAGSLPDDIYVGQHGGFSGVAETWRWVDKATGAKYRSDEIPARTAAVYELARIQCWPIAACDVEYADPKSGAKWEYTGEPIRPAVEVSSNLNCANCHIDHPLAVEDLEEGRDYTVSYRDNVRPGKASVVVTGKGKYQGEKVLEFSIADASASRPDDGNGSGAGNSGSNNGAGNGSGSGSGNGGSNGGTASPAPKRTVAFSEAVALPLDATGVAMDKDDIVRDLAKRFGSRKGFPADASSVAVTIMHGDKEVDAIDPRRAGAYEVTAVYSMPDGTERVIEATYTVADPTAKAPAKGAAKSTTRLAQTGDGAPAAVPAATAALAACALAAAMAARRRARG